MFSQHNVRTVMGTAQAGAVAIVCAARRGIPVALHTPSEVKAAVTGSGRADKAQVTAMVTRLLRLADPPRPADAADALALAICHIWRGGAQARLAAALARRRGRDHAGRARPVAGCGSARPGGTAAGGHCQQAALQQARRNGAALRRAALEQAMTRQTGGDRQEDRGDRASGRDGQRGGAGRRRHRRRRRRAAGAVHPRHAGRAAARRAGQGRDLAGGPGGRADPVRLRLDDERATFELVQTASGVGPRLALAMLAVFSPDGLRRAVAAEDLAALMTVPGIGRKGAQRIILELAGRLGAPGDGAAAGAGGLPGGAAGRAAPWRDQVRAGLVSLGWQAREADQAITVVEPELLAADGGDGRDVDVSAALRAALRVLGRT